MSEAQKNQQYIRFRIWERIEHVVLVVSFTTLGLTGLPQKYALNPISQAVINGLGGIETTRIIHHIAAAIFLLEAVYHAVIVFYKLYVQRKQATMLPGVKDATDAAQWFGYNLGINKVRPKMPRFNFMEKAEYWAMLWGLFVMALTGLMLWNPIATTNFLPGEFIPAAKSAHGGEAVLAVLAIILWHFYNVHIKHWNWSMIKGTISRHEMVEEHAAELEQIESGKLPQEPAPSVARQRVMVFAPIAVVFTLVFAGLTYYFLTFEKTAIATVPPAETAQVYVRPTPTMAAPTPTSAPQVAGSEAVVYSGPVETLLKDKCGSCHGSAGGFSAQSYDDVMKVVEAGKPDSSKLVEVQQAGGHPGQLTSDELTLVMNWIKAGAKQGEGSSTSGSSTSASGDVVWTGQIDSMLKDKCTACHGTTGGFSAETYDDVMKAVDPGNPDSSKIVEVQKAGNHPGQLTDDELNQLISWIKGGAKQGDTTAEATPTVDETPTPGANDEATPTAAAASGSKPTTWADGFETLFTDKCGTCHGAAASGGFTIATYDDVAKQLKAGDPDNSTIVKVQKAGGHPGMFSDDELQQVIDWIKAGAPQK